MANHGAVLSTRSAAEDRLIEELVARVPRFFRRPAQLSLYDLIRSRPQVPAMPRQPWPALLYTLGRSWLEHAALDDLLPDPHTSYRHSFDSLESLQ